MFSYFRCASFTLFVSYIQYLQYNTRIHCVLYMLFINAPVFVVVEDYPYLRGNKQGLCSFSTFLFAFTVHCNYVYIAHICAVCACDRRRLPSARGATIQQRRIQLKRQKTKEIGIQQTRDKCPFRETLDPSSRR